MVTLEYVMTVIAQFGIDDAAIKFGIPAQTLQSWINHKRVPQSIVRDTDTEYGLYDVRAYAATERTRLDELHAAMQFLDISAKQASSYTGVAYSYFWFDKGWSNKWTRNAVNRFDAFIQLRMREHDKAHGHLGKFARLTNRELREFIAGGNLHKDVLYILTGKHVTDFNTRTRVGGSWIGQHTAEILHKYADKLTLPDPVKVKLLIDNVNLNRLWRQPDFEDLVFGDKPFIPPERNVPQTHTPQVYTCREQLLTWLRKHKVSAMEFDVLLGEPGLAIYMLNGDPPLTAQQLLKVSQRTGISWESGSRKLQIPVIPLSQLGIELTRCMHVIGFNRLDVIRQVGCLPATLTSWMSGTNPPDNPNAHLKHWGGLVDAYGISCV